MSAPDIHYITLAVGFHLPPVSKPAQNLLSPPPSLIANSTVIQPRLKMKLTILAFWALGTTAVPVHVIPKGTLPSENLVMARTPVSTCLPVAVHPGAWESPCDMTDTTQGQQPSKQPSKQHKSGGCPRGTRPSRSPIRKKGVEREQASRGRRKRAYRRQGWAA